MPALKADPAEPRGLNTVPARPKTRPGRAEGDLPSTEAVKVQLPTIKGHCWQRYYVIVSA